MKREINVLIADDEPDVRYVLKTALERHGFKIQEAGNGLDALEKIKNDPPDVILLDIMMPRLDGYSLHQKLKENPGTKDTPIVIITGKGQMRELLDLRRELQVAAYLEKPFPIKILVEKLKEIFADEEG